MPDRNPPPTPDGDQPRPGRFAGDQPSVDPDALKALAHPLRMEMYSQLQRLGSATASQLGRILGESSGQTSYHLRQLQRHGFVEDDPQHSGGRERWWRPIGFSMTEPALLNDPSTAPAVRAVASQVIAERAAALTGWLANIDPADDSTDGLLSAATLAITPAEAEALTTELNEVMTRHADAIRGRATQAGSTRYRVYIDVFPLPKPELPG